MVGVLLWWCGGGELASPAGSGVWSDDGGEGYAGSRVESLALVVSFRDGMSPEPVSESALVQSGGDDF